MSPFANALLAKVKDALRITHNGMDDELIDIIDACKQDLMFAGVDNIDQEIPLIRRAVILYAKAHFSFSDDGQRFHQAYDSLKNLLRLVGEDDV